VRPEDVAAALSNPRRLSILSWLRRPKANFPPQVDGDLIDDGVCSLFIARKLRVTQASVSEHLRLLTDLGLLRSKRIKQWTFYKRDEKRIEAAKRALQRSF
jgi:ArsR family transcriptional regulator